ncbi:hypothetical protein HDU96_007712 [Phlyctochytrium bullatum]|nr:hypothetical protein HDU96_007712 [Phlyctochytrium bullatum]
MAPSDDYKPVKSTSHSRSKQPPATLSVGATVRLGLLVLAVIGILYMLFGGGGRGSSDWKRSPDAPMPLLDDSPDDNYDPFAAFEKIARFSEQDGSIRLLDPAHANHPNGETQEQSDASSNEATRMMRVVAPGLDPSVPVPIFDKDISASLTKIENNRYVRVTGFKYCDVLNNATFDSLAKVYRWGTTVARRDPLVDEFVQLIDSEALRLANVLYDNYPSALNSKDVKRFTCFAIADGSNPMANLTDNTLLHQVDSHHYISPIIPAINPAPSRIPGPRRKYKTRPAQLAFLLMCHGKSANLENVINLLNILDDGSAIILIHVDQKSEDLYNEVSKYVKEREAAMNRKLRPGQDPQLGNVFMAQSRFHGYWGHISLVWMQLSGFWELLDLADWDHVINLSAADFPLRYSRDMHRMLNSPTYRGRDFIERWEDNSESATRITRPHILRVSKSNVKDDIHLFHPKESGVNLPPFPRWKICKHHQWMILTPAFVRFLRTSDEALLALAFMEHTWIPDETYFCFVLVNTPEYGSRSVNGNKRFLKFNLGSMHPMTLDITSTGLVGLDGIGQEPQYLLIRKVEPRTSKGRQLLAWIHREHISKHADRDANGTLITEPEALELEGAQWVDREANMQGIAALLKKADGDAPAGGLASSKVPVRGGKAVEKPPPPMPPAPGAGAGADAAIPAQPAAKKSNPAPGTGAAKKHPGNPAAGGAVAPAPPQKDLPVGDMRPAAEVEGKLGSPLVNEPPAVPVAGEAEAEDAPEELPADERQQRNQQMVQDQMVEKGMKGHDLPGAEGEAGEP